MKGNPGFKSCVAFKFYLHCYAKVGLVIGKGGSHVVYFQHQSVERC
jgi:hypothetical protein